MRWLGSDGARGDASIDLYEPVEMRRQVSRLGPESFIRGVAETAGKGSVLMQRCELLSQVVFVAGSKPEATHAVGNGLARDAHIRDDRRNSMRSRLEHDEALSLVPEG